MHNKLKTSLNNKFLQIFSINILFKTSTIIIILIAISSCSSMKPSEQKTTITKTHQELNKTTTNEQIILTVEEGSSANYKVKEQLGNLDLPSYAIGKTKSLTGNIVFNKDGNIANNSLLELALKTLKSDKSRRDQYLRKNSLQSNIFPKATFKPQKLEGLPWPLPKSGKYSGKLSGIMSLHGETKPLTWIITVEFIDSTVIGTATTSFLFSDFEIQKPRVAIVLSVEDNITLEINLLGRINTP